MAQANASSVQGESRLGSRNENPNACLPAVEDGAESKALNADGSEGAWDTVD